MATLKQTLKLYYRAWKYRRADQNEIDWMLQHLKPGATAMDVGAHKGAYTYWMLKGVGAEGRVVAFEPQPSGTVLLRSLFGRKVTVEQLGLSDQSGQNFFYIQPQKGNVSYEASLIDKYGDSEEQVIETITLDQYCTQRQLKPALVKIDVEGHEWEVLQGGLDTLKQLRPYLLIEIEERHVGPERMGAIFGLLRDCGYAGYFFAGGRKLPLSEFRAAVHQSLQSLKGDGAAYINNFVFEPSI
ncbi:FkbM family methyltransferase [Flaviaesturariibacter amylovorans]|uniref:Methyltransferase FkbM domain-containing protein n=1 Tax=Flaviaesturariibacter amylovorans TaxID=1084520 RepID=A0ABP8GDX4_9BACT